VPGCVGAGAEGQELAWGGRNRPRSVLGEGITSGAREREARAPRGERGAATAARVRGDGERRRRCRGWAEEDERAGVGGRGVRGAEEEPLASRLWGGLRGGLREGWRDEIARDADLTTDMRCWQTHGRDRPTGG